MFEMDGVTYAFVRGVSRIRLEETLTAEPFLMVQMTEIAEVMEESEEMKALANYLLDEFKRALNLGKGADMVVLMRLASGAGPAELADQIGQTLDLKIAEKQGLLETPVVKERMERVITYLAREIKILELERSIAVKTQDRFDKGAKEAFLRERKRTIDKELKKLGGEEEEDDEEIRQLQQKIKGAKMPAAAEKRAFEELGRLKKMSVYNPEAGYIRTYLDWLVAMPWDTRTANNVSLIRAKGILDEDHYGLKKIKERILEYLAVMHLKQTQNEEQGGPALRSFSEGGPTILCFIGPPGVGKTSIGKSIARALGRKFVRISLGGIRDEAEIRGHRRTYVGALPGRIIQGIKTAGTKNPIFMLDEIDKVGTDFRGDPSAALLEALDPEQNREFSDHYLEVSFDLSEVFFITTGNLLDTIPPALRDRLEVIRFPGYTEEEKFAIAEGHLWTKQIRFHGLEGENLRLDNLALYEIIRRYTREAGVRELERNLATVCRKIARRVAEKKTYSKLISEKDIREFLGSPRFSATLAEKKDEVGLATGLAWTEAGGEILLIEVALMPGKGVLMLTGQLGDVMKESCQAAMSYVRAHWKQLGLKEGFAKKIDVHIHVPEGAVPKDGPSAGIAITVGIISALTKKPVRREVGMTGEITLRGRVLEIGGVKEKVIAGHRAGIKNIILPKDNRKDLEDIPPKIKREIKFIFVSHLDEVLRSVFRSYQP
jgi:ATP-dependent Lon protease